MRSILLLVLLTLHHKRGRTEGREATSVASGSRSTTDPLRSNSIPKYYNKHINIECYEQYLDPYSAWQFREKAVEYGGSR
ncbi:hypothetical protein GGS26DRAFT_576171 [Hypomontagnella submonticulosa]|nr:hypothetical protein GGS26DRAFT_576171 [Hypomontagnella submonticulosa]